MFTDVAGRRGGRLARVHAHLLLASLVLAGCTASLSTGPTRLYTVADETSLLRTQVASIESNFSLGVAQNEAARNEVIAERMLAIDMNYFEYEALLLRERQDVGFLSTIANLGLTGTATLITPVVTKNILTGVSTGLTGATKAYSDEVLFQKTIQALQTQMRANRLHVAAKIIARFNDSLQVYPLAMAKSDLEEYYNAGTLDAALLEVTQTVGDETKAADAEKAEAVASIKYSPDELTKLLRTFYSPNGKRDPVIYGNLQKWLQKNHPEEARPLGQILVDNSPSAKAIRLEMARAFNLIH